LLQTGKRVELVTDAIRHLNEAESTQMQEEFKSLGGVLVTTSEIC
jgi:hypothetical protein